MSKENLEILTRGAEEIIPEESFLKQIKSKKKLRVKKINMKENMLQMILNLLNLLLQILTTMFPHLAPLSHPK